MGARRATVPSATVAADDNLGSSTRARLWREMLPAIRLVSATVIIGAAAGALVGGVGGRIAMRVLLLTSDDTVRGLESDDGFEIGRFTLANTIGLLIVTALIGVLAALLFLVARPFVDRFGRAVVPLMAVLYGVLGGAMMVHRDGIDFRVLEPALLAITLFVAICAGFGAVVAWLVSAAAADDGWARTRSWWLLGPPLVLLVFPPFAVAAFAAGAFNWLAAVTNPRRWRVIEVGAYIVMSALFVFGVVDLARDTVALT
jgi:hypothetical protein